jgi:hypothetical protein
MTEKPYPIHDLYVRKLESTITKGVTSLPLLSFDDHLLRRFGFAEKISLAANHQGCMKVREVADEIWVCIEGKVQFHWWDCREDSPTKGQKFELMIEEPTLVLVPFGVAFGIRTMDGPAHVIRFSTHQEGIHEGDKEVPWEDGCL